MTDSRHCAPSTDILAFRAKVAVVVPATNTIVQPEFEAMRPAGVTNHVTRMLLPPRPYDDMEIYKRALANEEGGLEDALKLVLPCEPHVVAHGHSIHSFRGDRARAESEVAKLEAFCGIPFVTPSMAVLKGLEAIGNPRRIAVLTPYWPPADALIAEFFTACGYDVVASHGLKATGPTAVARITRDEIRAGFVAVDRPDAEVLIHVGTNLPVSAITDEIETAHGKPLIGVNVATYWLALRRLGIRDALPGFGILARVH
jgi:maleate isomerase